MTCMLPVRKAIITIIISCTYVHNPILLCKWSLLIFFFPNDEESLDNSKCLDVVPTK